MLERIKLFCIPYSGASAYTYCNWKKYLSPKIELVPIELSGHGSRINEPLNRTIDKIAKDVINTVSIEKNMSGCPYALFGHSFGALICYEITKLIDNSKHQLPEHVFLSGRTPPHMPKHMKLHDLPDDKLINALSRMNDIREMDKDNQMLMKIFLPIIRADIEAAEKYVDNFKHEQLNVDISVMVGRDDKYFTIEESYDWAIYTHKKMNTYAFEGAHLFIHTEAAFICEVINQTLVG